MPILQAFSGGTAAANLLYVCVQPGQVHLASGDYEVSPLGTYGSGPNTGFAGAGPTIGVPPAATFVLGGAANSALMAAAPTGMFVPFLVQVGIPGGPT
jgi:hypothetical protein